MIRTKNKTIILSIIGILIFLIIIGTSYSLFHYVKEGTTESSIKIGDITFIYTEDKELGNGIRIEDAMPMSDEEGKKLEGEGNYFDFKINSNLSRSDLEYEVVAQQGEGSTLPLDAIKLYMTDITSEEEIEIESTINEEKAVKTLEEYSDTEIEKVEGKTIYQETILKNTKGYEKKFRVRMWIKEGLDWSDDKYMGKSGSIRINVYANSDKSMASTSPTTPDDVRIERVVGNQKYLFDESKQENYQYTVTVPNEVSVMNIEIVPSNIEATAIVSPMEGNSNSLKVGDNFFQAAVTSSNGEKTKEYILRVVREKSTNTGLKSLTVGNYNLEPTYSNTIDNYIVHVPYEITSVEVTAEALEDVQKIEGEGLKNLEIGDNVFTIKVTAENGTERNININIHRLLSDDASIQNVGVNGYQLTLLEGKTYKTTVPFNIKKITIVNETTTGATVTNLGEKELVVGNNDFEVEVTSASGKVTEKYTIRVIREKETDNLLKSLNLTECTLNPKFSPTTTEYSCTVENSVIETTITLEKSGEESEVIYTPKHTLSVGENTIEIKVKAQSGDIKIYTVTVTRKPNNDATLSNLVVKDKTGKTYNLTPQFSKELTSYTLSVPYNIENIILEATKSQSVSTLEGDGEKHLTVGTNPFDITVTAEDVTITKTYRITITREKDTDNTLSSLSVSNCTLTPQFSSSTTDYSCTVENNITSVEVIAEANSKVATVAYEKEHTLLVGKNTILVTVTAQNTSKKTYTVDVTRKPNSDATLKSLAVTNQSISPDFNKNTLEYTLTVPYSVDKITITASPSQSVSHIDGIGQKTLEVGTKKFDITVTAEDGITKKIYSITVTRQQDHDTSLKSIGVKGYEIVKNDEHHYTLTVANNITSVEVTAEANSKVANVVGAKTYSDLKVGENKITVTVTAQDGTVSNYEIIITRLPSSDATLKSLTVTNYNLSPNFSSTVMSYNLTVANSVTSITVSATATHTKATVEITGNTSLKEGNNTVTITVTAEDKKTTKSYIINVKKMKKDTVSLTQKTATYTGDAIVANTASATSGTDITYSYYKTTNCTGDAITAPTNVGNYSVKAISKGNSDYESGNICVPHTITKGKPTITLTQKIATYTGSAIPANQATATNPNGTAVELTYTYKYYTDSSCTTAFNKDTPTTAPTNANTYYVTATSGVTDNLNSTTSNCVKHVINKKKDTVSLTPKNTTYTGDAIVANTASATSQSEITYTYYSSIDCSGTALNNGAPIDVGNYSVKAVSKGNSNYTSENKCVTHTITKGTPKITLTEKSIEATGSAIPANSATATNPNGTTVTLTYTYKYYTDSSCKTSVNSTPTTAPTDVGTYYAQATSNATTNLVSSNSNCAKLTIKNNTNTNLKTLSIENYTINPSFAKDTTAYTLTLEEKSITVNAQPESSLSEVTGTGLKTLSWGVQAITVTVKAQSGATKTYTITVTNQRPTPPEITGGSNSWVSAAPNITISKQGTAISGVNYYEYYKSVNNTSPTDTTTAAVQLTTSPYNLTINNEGTTYVWYRTVSNNGNKSPWTSSPQVIKLDTTNPTVTVSVNGKVATLTLKDNLGVTGWAVNQSTTAPSSWNAITSTTSTTATYTATTSGSYRAWIKDASGRTGSATFTIAASSFCSVALNYKWTFNYTGSIQTWKAPCDGTYKLEVYGAQGGNVTEAGTTLVSGGAGGYASGKKILSTNSVLYVVVGGMGGNTTTAWGIADTGHNNINGGYNGGGKGSFNFFGNYSKQSYGGGGGGATHIATTNRGVLSSYNSYRGEVLIVAGGGGGGYLSGSIKYSGGTGGGASGGNGTGGSAGTQSTGYSFGLGQSGPNVPSNGSNSGYASGGGGGYFGGKTLSSTGDGSGGGGSGYIGGVTSGSMSNGQRSGNGVAYITLTSTN